MIEYELIAAPAATHSRQILKREPATGHIPKHSFWSRRLERIPAQPVDPVMMNGHAAFAAIVAVPPKRIPKAQQIPYCAADRPIGNERGEDGRPSHRVGAA